MLDTPHITHTEARQTAVIHLTIPRADIMHVMGPGIQELMATVAAQGISPTGPWFSHHLAMHPDTFDFEIGIPVASPVTPAGRVTPGSLPATRVARTVLHGNYDGLGPGWGEFLNWIHGRGTPPRPTCGKCMSKARSRIPIRPPGALNSISHCSLELQRRS